MYNFSSGSCGLTSKIGFFLLDTRRHLCPKPAPDIYLKACEIIGTEPKNCYALEDSRNGLLSAYRAGCKPIMVPDLWQPDEAIMKIIVAKYDDLEQVTAAFETLP